MTEGLEALLSASDMVNHAIGSSQAARSDRSADKALRRRQRVANAADEWRRSEREYNPSVPAGAPPPPERAQQGQVFDFCATDMQKRLIGSMQQTRGATRRDPALQNAAPTLGQNMGAWAEVMSALEPHQQDRMRVALRILRQRAYTHNTLQLFNMMTRAFGDGVKPIRGPWQQNALYAAPSVEHVEALFIEVASRFGAARLIGLLETEAHLRFAAAPSTPPPPGILGARTTQGEGNQYTASTHSYPRAQSVPNVEALFQAHQLGQLYTVWPRDRQEAMQQAIAAALRICYEQNPEIALRRMSQGSGPNGTQPPLVKPGPYEEYGADRPHVLNMLLTGAREVHPARMYHLLNQPSPSEPQTPATRTQATKRQKNTRRAERRGRGRASPPPLASPPPTAPSSPR